MDGTLGFGRGLKLGEPLTVGCEEADASGSELTAIHG
jgi:hypothetical protein